MNRPDNLILLLESYQRIRYIRGLSKPPKRSIEQWLEDVKDVLYQANLIDEQSNLLVPV